MDIRETVKEINNDEDDDKFDYPTLYLELSYKLRDRSDIYGALCRVIEYMEEEDPEEPSLASFRTLLSALRQLIEASKNGLDVSSYKERLDQIFLETWQLIDHLRWNHMEHTPMIFAVDNLVAELEPQHLATIDDYQLECIFNTIRTTYPIGKDLRTALHQAILTDELPMYLRATLLSAMTLNVLEWFDADLLEFMYTYTLDDQPVQLRQQSWAALFLCGMVHDQRIVHHPRLREEYLLLCEIEPAQLAQLQKLLLPLREYESFTRNLHKLIDDMAQSKRIENDEEEESEEQHFEITNDSENFKQFLELMRSNVDTGYTQFKLMSKLGFFSMEGTDHHWLMPFDKECEIIKKLLEEKPELQYWYEMLLHNLAQTNTDKYATFLLMANTAERVKELNSKLAGLNLPEGKLADLGADMIMQIHLQDLYRFFTLSKTGRKLKNPFRLTPDLSSYECFGKAFHTADNLRTVAEYLFKSEKYEEAAQTYERLLELEITEQNLKNSILCLNHLNGGSFKIKPLAHLYNKLFPVDEDVLNAVIRAYNINDPSLEPYYQEALENFPDSFHFMLSYGEYLNENKRYSDALKTLYKAYMIDESNEKVILGLAQAHAHLGQKDKAFALLNHLDNPQEHCLLMHDILSNN